MRLRPAQAAVCTTWVSFTLLRQEERVRALAAAADLPIDVVVVPDEGLPEALRSPLRFSSDLALSTARIRAELGYAETVRPDDALRRTIAWMRDAGSRLPRPSDAELRADDRILESGARAAL